MKYLIHKWWFWLWMVIQGLILSYKQWQVDQLIHKLGID